MEGIAESQTESDSAHYSVPATEAELESATRKRWLKRNRNYKHLKSYNGFQDLLLNPLQNRIQDLGWEKLLLLCFF